MNIKGLILLLVAFYSFNAVQGLVCNEIYVRKDKEAVLSFHADIRSETVINYKIWSPLKTGLLTVVYFNNKLLSNVTLENCTFIGTPETGDLKIVLAKPYTGGEYFLNRTENGVTTQNQCISLYLLDVPVKPTITSDNVPFVGSTVTLTCSSASTTTPSNLAIGLLYNWKIDGLDNPIDSRYSYTLSRRNLTLTNVIKEDRNKKFTCTATENVTDGYTSMSSNTVLITVYYGPDSVSLLPNNTTYSVDENAYLANISCSADCSPACSYMWKKANQPNAVTNSGVLPLGAISRQYSGVYTCTARSTVMPSKYQEAQVTVEVKYGPEETSTRLMPVTQQYHENENEKALPDITCSADCFPTCSIVWTKQPNNAVPIVPSQGVLSLGTPSRRDAAIYTCTVTNPARVSSPTITRDVNINIRYGPDRADLNVPNNYTITEGEPVGSLTCLSDCYPNCSYQWTKDSVAVGSDGIIQLVTAARHQAGNYTCTARNTASQYPRSSGSSAIITVRYPPDVSITTYNASVNMPSTVLECIARGVPSSNYKYGNWIQIWPGGTVVSERSGSPRLEMFNLTYEHSGIYKCSASNGVRVYGTEKEYMEGSTFLLIASFPVIIKPTSSTMEIVTAKLNANATFMIEYYSNIDVTGIECYKVLNLIQQSRIECKVEHQTKMVDLPVFSNFVRTPGEEANIFIEIDREEKFGPYNIIIANKFSHTMMSIDVKPVGPPYPPNDIIIDRIKQTTVRLSWTPGFNGGFTQSFVIQRQAGTEEWHNLSLVEEPLHETIIKGLKHSTTYSVRMYAFNVNGRSEYTVAYNFTTSLECDESTTSGNSSALIIGVVLGTVVIGLVVLVSILILKLRRLLNLKGKGVSGKSPSPRAIPCYANVTYIKDSTEKEDWPTSGGVLLTELQVDNQYTSLETRSRNDASTYDVIIANH